MLERCRAPVRLSGGSDCLIPSDSAGTLRPFILAPVTVSAMTEELKIAAGAVKASGSHRSFLV